MKPRSEQRIRFQQALSLRSHDGIVFSAEGVVGNHDNIVDAITDLTE